MKVLPSKRRIGTSALTEPVAARSAKAARVVGSSLNSKPWRPRLQISASESPRISQAAGLAARTRPLGTVNIMPSGLWVKIAA